MRKNTEEQKILKRAKNAEEAKLRRAQQTAEERALQRARNAELARIRRAEQTEEERASQRARSAELARIRRAEKTEEERASQRARNVELARIRRAQRTEDQLALKRARDSEQKRIRRVQGLISEEERALRRVRAVERYRGRRGLLLKSELVTQSSILPESNPNNNETGTKSSLTGPQHSPQQQKQETNNLVKVDESLSEETRNILSEIQSLKIAVRSLRKATLGVVKSNVKAAVERVKGKIVAPTVKSVVSVEVNRARRKIERIILSTKAPVMKPFAIRLPNIGRGSTSKKFVCPVCSEGLDNNGRLLVHLQMHTIKELEVARESLSNLPPGESTQFTLGMYSCEICPENLFNIISFRKHLIGSHRDNREILAKLCFLCSLCDEVFASKKSLTSHQRFFHKIYIKCPICNEILQTQEQFTEHMEKLHHDCVEDDMCFTSSEGYVCRLCGYTNPIKFRMAVHFRTHSLQKPFQCSECGKEFTTEKDIVRHKRKIHTGKSFVCEKCGKNFKSRQNLGSHVKYQHGQKKPAFKCKECGKILKSFNSLKTHHTAKHTTEKPFQCDICGKAFSLHSSYWHHKINYCEKYEAEKRTCSICQKVLDNVYLLSYHKNNIHKYGNTEETVCNRCNKTMSNPQALYVHNNMYHSNKIGKRNLECIFQCKVCEKGFKSRQELFNHWRTHNDERPFKCSLCDATFRYPPNMPQHRKSAHKNDTEKAIVVVDKQMNTMLREKFKRLYPNLVGTEGTASGDEEAEMDNLDAETVGIGADQSVTINVANTCELGSKAANGIPEVLLDVTRTVPVMKKPTYVDFSRANVPELSTKTSEPLPPNINDDKISDQSLVDEISNVNNFNPIWTGDVVPESEYIDLSELDFSPISVFNDGGFSEEEVENTRLQPKLVPEDPSPKKLVISLEKLKMQNCSDLGTRKILIDSSESRAVDGDEFHFTSQDLPMTNSDVEDFIEDEYKDVILRAEWFPEDPYPKKLIVKLERLKKQTCLTCNFVTYIFKDHKKHLNSRAHRMATRNTNKGNYLEDDVSVLSYSSDETDTPETHSKSSSEKRLNNSNSAKRAMKYNRSVTEMRIKKLRKPRVYTCSFCGEKLESFTVYKTHLAFHADEKFRCELCTVKFETSKELTDHCKKIHEGKMPFQCGECSSGFVTLYLLVRHKNKHHHSQHGNNQKKRRKMSNRISRPFSCDKCPRKFIRKYHLDCHIGVHQKLRQRTCKFCTQVFGRLENLKEHHKQAHPAEKFERRKFTRKKKEKYVCRICNSKFNDLTLLKKHRQIHYDKAYYQKQKKAYVPGPGHICDICGTTIKRLCHLRDHMKRHENGRPVRVFKKKCIPGDQQGKSKVERPSDVTCSVCSVKFRTQNALDLHSGVHDSSRRYRCDQCSFYFRTNSHLKRHILSTHEKKTHTCDICSKSYARPDELRQHCKKVHPENYKSLDQRVRKPKKLFCAKCKVEFSDFKSLREHRKVHDVEDTRYKCPHCPRPHYCLNQARLDTHLKLHDSSRPFSCNLCSFFFNHNSNLALHVKNVHERMGIDYSVKRKKPLKANKNLHEK